MTASCYSLAVMLPRTMLLVAGLSASGLACGDDGGDENAKICLPADDFESNLVSGLFEPCIGDHNCMVGRCKNGFCSENCGEDDDCEAQFSTCELEAPNLGVCVYYCDSDGVGCPGADVHDGFSNMRCEGNACASTFTCEDGR